ncbi:MAG: CotH kinase family protein [Pseudobutyrivibrio sp.]|nr:CotH kinase family protein [Pseudobutyrivibrio sp.]
MKNNKLILFIVSILALVIVFLWDYFDIGHQVLIQEDNVPNLFFSKLKEVDPRPEEYTYNDNPVAYAKEDNTFYVSIDLDSLTDEDRELKEAIASGKVFTVFVQVDLTSYFKSNLIYTGMPLMTMDTLEEDAGKFADEDGWKSQICIWNPTDKDRPYIEDEASVKYRGATSLNYPKKGMRFHLEDGKYALLGMDEDDDWNMNALYDDAGLIHNQLSYNLWNQIADNNKIEYDNGIYQEYIEVIIDGQYMGVYGLQDRYDKKKLHLKSGDILYKTISGSTPTTPQEVMDWSTDIKWPDDWEVADYLPICDWFTVFSTRESDYDYACSILDLDQAVDFALFSNMVCGRDNRLKNIYHICRMNDDGTYNFQSLPWDENVTWGQAIADTGVFFTEENYAYEELPWDMRTFCNINPVDASELLYMRWLDLREDIITKDSLENQTAEIYAYLHESGAYERNYNKWPESAAGWDDDYIYAFIENRLLYLDEYYSTFYKENH